MDDQSNKSLGVSSGVVGPSTNANGDSLAVAAVSGSLSSLPGNIELSVEEALKMPTKGTRGRKKAPVAPKKALVDPEKTKPQLADGGGLGQQPVQQQQQQQQQQPIATQAEEQIDTSTSPGGKQTGEQLLEEVKRGGGGDDDTTTRLLPQQTFKDRIFPPRDGPASNYSNPKIFDRGITKTWQENFQRVQKLSEEHEKLMQKSKWRRFR